MMLVSIWMINKYRKTLVNKLVEECNEIIEEVKIVGENKNKYGSCIFYMVSFLIFFTISIEIGVCFAYYKYMNHNKENISKYDYTYQAKNY